MAQQMQPHFSFGNRGFEVGSNTGSIINNLHLARDQPERPPKPRLAIPFLRDPDFVHRGRLHEQIHNSCLGSGRRAALWGKGGVGKSQLAIEYAYQTSCEAAKRGQPMWVFWIHAETRARVEDDFRRIAAAINLSQWDDPETDIVPLVEQWLLREENGPWLLILDSANDDRVFFDPPPSTNHVSERQGGSARRTRQLGTYLPQCQHGSILVTTKNKRVVKRLVADHDIIEVLPMGTEDALQLLKRKTATLPDMEHGRTLVEALDYMPLAISQAGAYIRHRSPRTSIGRYLAEFRKSDRHKLNLLNQDEGDIRRDYEASNSVITTWQISFNSIRSERPSAADLLSSMSFFDHQGIQEWLLRLPSHDLDHYDHSSQGENDAGSVQGDGDECGSDSELSDSSVVSEGSTRHSFEDDLLILRDYSLISLNETGDIIRLHSLVQLATRSWLKINDQEEVFKNQFVNSMAREFPEGRYINWTTCRELFAHVEGAITHRPSGGGPLQEWAQILHNGGMYAQTQGEYDLAEKMVKKSRNAREEILGKDHELVWDSVSLLGEIKLHQGKYEKAERLFTMAIAAWKRMCRPDHLDMLNDMANLAVAYWRQGRWAEAERLELDVLDASQKILPGDHSESLASMANLAVTYQSQDRLDEAVKLQKMVLATAKDKFGSDHLDTLNSMGNLASMYRDQGRLDEAEELEVGVVSSRKRRLPADHTDTLTSMSNLALTYTSQGRWNDAEKLQLEVFEARRKKFRPNHPDTLASMVSLAATYWKTDRIDEAKKLEVEVIDAQKNELGLDHPETLTTMANLASTLHSQGFGTEAIELMETCVRLHYKKPEPAHATILDLLSTISTWRMQQRLQSSEASGFPTNNEDLNRPMIIKIKMDYTRSDAAELFKALKQGKILSMVEPIVLEKLAELVPED